MNICRFLDDLLFATASEQVLVVEESIPPAAPKPAILEERLSPRAEMRLALDQGKDMLVDQEVSWVSTYFKRENYREYN